MRFLSVHRVCCNYHTHILNAGFNNLEVYQEFSKRISNIKGELLEFLDKEAKNGKVTYIYGASTRGLVVLQYRLDLTLPVFQSCLP